MHARATHDPDSLAPADGDLGTQILAPQVKAWAYRLKRYVPAKYDLDVR